MKLRRGDLVLVNLDPTIGKEINKTRPAIIVSNNIANHFSPLITIVPVTSQKLEKLYPFEVLIENKRHLSKTPKAKADQTRTVDKKRIVKKLSELDRQEMQKLDEALKLHLGL